MSAQLFFVSENKSHKPNDTEIIKDLELLKIAVAQSKSVTIDEVIREVSSALKTSQIIIIVGGTKVSNSANVRERLAAATSNSLIIDRPSYNKMMNELDIDEIADAKEHEREIMVPSGSIVFQNALSYSPGFSLESGKQRIVVLPDDEDESNVMFSTAVCTYLSDLSVLKTSAVALKLFGITKEKAEEKINEIICVPFTKIDVVSADGEIIIKLSATSQTVQEATAAVAEMARKLKAVLGDYIYGTEHDNLADVITEKANKINAKIAIAESGTDDALSKILSTAKDISDVLIFGVSASSDSIKTKTLNVSESIIKKYSSSSEETAIAMAYGAAKESRADISVAITGFVKGKKSSESDVYISLFYCDNVWTKRLNLNDKDFEKNSAAEYASLFALDMIRRCLEGQQSAKSEFVPLGGGKDKAISAAADEARSFYKTKQNEKTEVAKRAPKKKEALFIRFLKAIFPNTSETAKGNIRKIIMLACAVVVIVSGTYIFNYYFETYMTGLSVEKLDALYNEPTAENGDMPKGYLPKFASLYAINKDVKGWLEISGTELKYPVVQKEGDTENAYYLRKNFNGESSKHGVLFIDFRNSVDMMSDNTIIYGHNINDDGLMFSQITPYRELDFYKAHPVITFDTVYEESKWKVVSVFMANIHPEQGEVFDYIQFTDAQNDDEFLDYVYGTQVRSLINTGIDVVPGDKLLTLSTCSYEYTDARVVVVARKVRAGESAEVDTKLATKNETPLMPDIWYKTYGGEKPYIPARPKTESSSSSSSSHTSSSSSKDESSDSSEDEKSSSSSSKPASSSSSSSKPQSSSSSKAESSSSSKVSSSSSSNSSSSSSSSSQSSSVSVSSSSAQSSSLVQSLPESSSSQIQNTGTPSTPSNPTTVPPTSATIRVNLAGVVGDYPVVDVLSQIVANEMGNSFHAEALKAQAVAGHSYLVANSSNTPYIGRIKTPTANTIALVSEVADKLVYYNGAVANTVYHAMAAGTTEDARNVWGGSVPYLIPVDSSWDRNVSTYYSTRIYSAETVRSKLLAYNPAINLAADPATWLAITSYTSGGYVGTVNVCGTVITGRQLRERVFGYDLRSTKFAVSYQGGNFVFTVEGYGHGVGMSQQGANQMANMGKSYIEILKHYYTGVEVY